MYQVSLDPITPDLWRWKNRYGGALLRCGSAPNKGTAERNVNEVVSI